MSNPECRQLDLSSFLLEPMQRITRYALLLKQVKFENYKFLFLIIFNLLLSIYISKRAKKSIKKLIKLINIFK